MDEQEQRLAHLEEKLITIDHKLDLLKTELTSAGIFFLAMVICLHEGFSVAKSLLIGFAAGLVFLVLSPGRKTLKYRKKLRGGWR